MDVDASTLEVIGLERLHKSYVFSRARPYFCQNARVIIINNGKISKRPVSMATTSSHLLGSFKGEKESFTAPIPDPEALATPQTANEKEVIKSLLHAINNKTKIANIIKKTNTKPKIDYRTNSLMLC